MKLWAISDLHLGHEANRQALENLSHYGEDWLILAGDVGETAAQLDLALRRLRPRFAKLLWAPGNHDLWTVSSDPQAPRGVALYEHLVSLCRSQGVLTPEDPYPIWPGDGPPCTVAPLFLLYDYSFRPDDVPAEQAVDWATESGIVCADEGYLHPDPYPSRVAWCEARCRATASRLAQVKRDNPLVLVNHFPLRRDLVRLPSIPRFSIWCGTRITEDWHRRFPVYAVVSGHLHIRSTLWRDGVRFEEVSLGYPHQWRQQRGMDSYLREILPGPMSLAGFC